ncbi:RagB/SusD family nutrient uptake outer membrane protein [Flavicella marina]|uniref:RagB/SusD family nutrient uptake outer membrane protein n=1 Tax=Flavicella marina TaxID=1475951 RepID=UPI001265721D|nr:RagB/SusD family nutrient uptake outer membrane protein [Flavicella marina]
MKNIINLAIISVALISFSCSDDFLNEPKPTDAVTENVIFDSREGVEAHLSGIQRFYRDQFRGADGSTDTGGMYSMYFVRTVKANDIIQGVSWFLFDYDNDNREPNYRRTIFTWDYPYYMINQANSIIQGLADSNLGVNDIKQLEAQAKAHRAFFYFQLAMEFQHTYSYDPSLPAPPIYTEMATEGKPMSTLSEMYDLIIDDLTYAVANLDENRLGKSYINKQVASGILARVYLVTENWQGARDAAISAYGGNPSASLNASEYGNGFDKIENTEWIWGSPQTNDQSNYYYAAPHAFSDHFADGYYASYINEDFRALFSATDVRNLFDETYVPAVGTEYKFLTTTKFKFAFDSDLPLMRTAEMILIEAEAKHRLSDPTAHDILFSLQSNRDPNAVKSSNTGAALLEEILVERRKELYAELGVEWFDAKRLRRAIPRTGNHRLPNSDLAADDPHFFLKIPQKEIDANDNIDASVNDGKNR